MSWSMAVPPMLGDVFTAMVMNILGDVLVLLCCVFILAFIGFFGWLLVQVWKDCV